MNFSQKFKFWIFFTKKTLEEFWGQFINFKDIKIIKRKIEKKSMGRLENFRKKNHETKLRNRTQNFIFSFTKTFFTFEIRMLKKFKTKKISQNFLSPTNYNFSTLSLHKLPKTITHQSPLLLFLKNYFFYWNLPLDLGLIITSFTLAFHAS